MTTVIIICFKFNFGNIFFLGGSFAPVSAPVVVSRLSPTRELEIPDGKLLIGGSPLQSNIQPQLELCSNYMTNYYEFYGTK
jgi:hypothetical protein